MAASCLHCARINSCPVLSDIDGNFVPERVLEDAADIRCDRWEAMGPRERRDRDRLFNMSGVGSLRALHLLPTKDLDAELLREKEVMELQINDDIPDFNGMRIDGMLVSERRDQLLYETNEAGEVLYVDFEGVPTPKPRPQYQLRNYACDPDGPIKLGARQALFDPLKKTLDLIIREETKQKLIVRDPKKGIEDTDSQPEETSMAKGKRVIVRNAGKGKPAAKGSAVPNKAAGGEGKVAKPPRTIVGRGKGKGKPVAATEALPDAPPAAAETAVDLSEIVASLNGLHERLDGMEKAITELRGGGDGDVAERLEKLIQAMGVWHDVQVLSGGSMQAIPALDKDGEALYDDEGELLTSEVMPIAGTANGILSYIDGPGDDSPCTAYLLLPPPEDDEGEE